MRALFLGNFGRIPSLAQCAIVPFFSLKTFKFSHWQSMSLFSAVAFNNNMLIFSAVYSFKSILFFIVRWGFKNKRTLRLFPHILVTGHFWILASMPTKRTDSWSLWFKAISTLLNYSGCQAHEASQIKVVRKWVI